MRKEAKAKRRAKCAYEKCHKEQFKKNLGYLYKGVYYCSRNHARKAKQENARPKTS